MSEKKSAANVLEEKLLVQRKNAAETLTEAQIRECDDFCEGYKNFMDSAKIEREAVIYSEELLKSKGFKEFQKGMKLSAGDKVYLNNRGKAILMAVIGKAPVSEGVRLCAAHIDSPRLDLKQNPLYEDTDMALFKTHYYGGIKKYQWVARPLALHGVVAKKDGTVLNVVIGEDENDPVVGISDLLIHLSQEQMTKKASEVITGEGLDIILAGKPLKGEEQDAVKAQLVKLLKEKYGIEEEDFLSAEIEAVPADKARDFGLDRSMILGYGHDDRVCAYAELQAMLSLPAVPKYTACCILTDKEEIGSVGATGMEAKFFENAVYELIALCGGNAALGVRRALANSRMLSCDVSAGFDPMFAEAFEKKNAAMLGRGVCYNKFTGSRGKSGSNDANAEFIGRVRACMDDAQVAWQTAELGRVDLGGGGTIAYICALYGMEVIDSGVAVLNMHAPQEIISKADLYEAIRAYTAFAVNMGPRSDEI